jgi:hypothetical protein
MVASGSRTMIAGSLSSLYEGLACQEVFSRSTFLPFRFERLAQAQFCVDGTAGPPCLAALSGQPPEPGGSRRKARGVDGESACRATMASGHYAANVTALYVLFDPSFPVEVSITFVQ